MQTPRYEYSRSVLQKTINLFLGLSSPYGLSVRYAVKANPHAEIIKMIDEAGLSFDASSSYEASLLLDQGVKGNKISLSSQQSADNLSDLLSKDVLFVATSMNQLKLFIDCPNRPDKVGVRINIGIGQGHNNRTSTGGVNSSFGIWYEYIEEVKSLASSANVQIDRIHIHIGSGADVGVWERVIDASLNIVEKFETCTSVNIGGGFKVHRYADEKETDIKNIVEMFGQKLIEFKEKTNREISLEIEPGTYFVAHAGTLVAQVNDIVDTGKEGFKFIKLNTGMNDFLRSTMYGARHKIEVINDSISTEDYIVVGHNCESGDLLSPVAGNSEEMETRTLKQANIGDEVLIYDTGAYCASMRAKGYNSFPDAAEIMVD